MYSRIYSPACIWGFIFDVRREEGGGYNYYWRVARGGRFWASLKHWAYLTSSGDAWRERRRLYIPVWNPCCAQEPPISAARVSVPALCQESLVPLVHAPGYKSCHVHTTSYKNKFVWILCKVEALRRDNQFNQYTYIPSQSAAPHSTSYLHYANYNNNNNNNNNNITIIA